MGGQSPCMKTWRMPNCDHANPMLDFSAQSSGATFGLPSICTQGLVLFSGLYTKAVIAFKLHPRVGALFVVACQGRRCFWLSTCASVQAQPERLVLPFRS